MSWTIPEYDHTSGDILIVDDNAANLLAMEAALEGLGGRVVRAPSGEEALRVLLDQDFALILLDVKMPSMGGFETAKLIRERKRSRHTPIIFITAYGRDEHDVLSAYELGAVDFLFKPIVAEVLQSKASVFVELQRRTAEVARQAALLRDHERREHERTLEEERRRWDEEALRRQMEELAEADRRKDEFLAMLGHELRNPLSAIIVGCELLKRKLSTGTDVDDSVHQTRDRIDRQAQHLKRLVDDLLDIARINSGKIELKKAPTSIQQIVEHAVATSAPLIEEFRHRLTVNVPDDPIRLVADAVRLTQAIANLLSNAARYTDEGGSIAVDCVRKDSAIEIRVTDNGRGIGPELLPRVFDIFVQEETNGGGHGLGLGLTIVKRLVAMHQGTVAAASDGLRKGSTFTITLPMDPPELATVVEAAPVQANGTTARTSLAIVLVEDNEDIREGMQELLSGMGHRVQVAADGALGLELILRVAPDVALVDLGLPVLDGYEVAARVRSEKTKERPIRLVAMTGYGQESDRRRAKEAGFDAHLTKPADMGALIKLLSTEDT